MPPTIRFDRSPDALYQGVPLRYRLDLPVLGVPVRYESNSPDAIAAVEAAYGPWRALARRRGLLARGGVLIRLIVHEGEEGGGEHAPVTSRMPGRDRLIVTTPGSFGIADGRRREAVAYLTPALLADAAHARYAMLEGLTLTMVTMTNRYPVHAAAIARGGAALLLAGPPGVGKSTLAYQARRFARVLSDDAAYVQLTPRFRLWGMPGSVYLTPDAPSHFAELSGARSELRADGEPKLRVAVADATRFAPPVADRAAVVLLERGGRGGVACVSATPAEITAFLTQGVGLSRGRFGPSLGVAHRRLARRGGWRVSLSDDPADAAPLIEELLGRVARTSSRS